MADAPQFGNKNVLVAGGAGFIGSFLCEKLLKDNRVICVDNFTSSTPDNIAHLLKNPDFELIRHDLSEPLDLSRHPELDRFKIPVLGIQQVYNLACPMTIKNFMERREEILYANSAVVRNTLRLAFEHGGRYLLASSSVVYGPRGAKQHICHEDEVHPVDHMSTRACYDEGKRWAETMVNTVKEVRKLETRIARIFRTYGPRMPIDDGQMIPDFVIAAMEDRDVTIYGGDDFRSTLVYVTDVVDGLMRLMKNQTDPGPVNIGSDEDFSMRDVAKHIIKLLGSKSAIVEGKEMLFLSELGIPDLTKAKETIGWFPIVPFHQGLRKTVEYALAARGQVRSLKDA